jgi:nitrogen fixation protein FixH
MNNGDLTVSRTPARRFARWPVILIGLLIVQAAGILWMVTIAGSDPSFAVEPHYYEKAVAWDEAARQEGVNRALAWNAEASISRAGAQNRRTLRVVLSDSLGRPLEGASVAAEVFHQARAGERTRVECLSKEPGVYAGEAALARDGVYEVRLTIARGPDVFTHVLTIDAQRATP